jgi:hypothetical protein
LGTDGRGGEFKDGAARGLYRRRKRRRARARALPDTAGAKPGGADTTPQIIKLKKNISYLKYLIIKVSFFFYNKKFFLFFYFFIFLLFLKNISFLYLYF